jgi:hypothetical protein
MDLNSFVALMACMGGFPGLLCGTGMMMVYIFSFFPACTAIYTPTTPSLTHAETGVEMID